MPSFIAVDTDGKVVAHTGGEITVDQFDQFDQFVNQVAAGKA